MPLVTQLVLMERPRVKTGRNVGSDWFLDFNCPGLNPPLNINLTRNNNSSVHTNIPNTACSLFATMCKLPTYTYQEQTSNLHMRLMSYSSLFINIFGCSLHFARTLNPSQTFPGSDMQQVP
ncbi:hypothetical protein DPEC_G00356980 [Dallia pectoralis]|uniref:Uncharacterized protein n=1 Tax=Dallia pectoralis TaxID=75939 RepID=A0ACC2EZZ8_DALPE|nr:hypothetical protein DPEC_G00356980 [Dallia pectoralis]